MISNDIYHVDKCKYLNKSPIRFVTPFSMTDCIQKNKDYLHLINFHAIFENYFHYFLISIYFNQI